MCLHAACERAARAPPPPTPRFASGGDDCLLNLLVESCKVRAIASPAAALAALAAAIVMPCTHAAVARALLCAAHTHALCPWPSQAVTAAVCAQLLAGGVACDKWQIQKWPFATV
jgi:hypothetical protein